MAIFHGNAIPSGTSKQKTWSPTSNGWDYTFDGSGEWPAAGNSLGDDSDGGYIDNTGSNSAIYSLFTFDGDFEIEWTLTDENEATWGVHAIDEDDERGTDDDGNMLQMTNSFWRKGESDRDFYIGSSRTNANPTIADGSVIKIERVSGTIKVYDDGSAIHTFGTTYSGTMRFCISAPGSSHDADFDNILFTDSEGVQRDGFYNESAGAARGWGGSSSERYYGFAWKPTRTGEIAEVIGDMITHTANFDSNCTVYTENSAGTSPDSLLGTSNTLSLTSAGTKTWTFSTKPTVNKGTWYWLVFSDLDGSGNTNFVTIGNYGSNYFKSGKAGAIGSIVDHSSYGDLKVDVKIETTEEPTPDHDTLLLIHSDTTDGSTTFVDSSQFARTDTVNGDTHHETDQAKFGASSIQFDGTGDYLTFPDSNDWDFGVTGAFTIECWYKGTDVSAELICKEQANVSWGTVTWHLDMNSAGDLRFEMSNNHSPGVSITATTNINDDAWHHCAIVRRGNRFDLYVDGTSEANTTNAISCYQGTEVVAIGADSSGNNLLTGFVDEVRISRVARWDANFTPPTAPYP